LKTYIRHVIVPVFIILFGIPEYLSYTYSLKTILNMTYKSPKPVLLFILGALFLASVFTISCTNEKKADPGKTETSADSTKKAMDSAGTRPTKPPDNP
jgi:hypothetical protein